MSDLTTVRPCRLRGRVHGVLIVLLMAGLAAPVPTVYAQDDAKASADAAKQAEEFGHQKIDIIAKLKELKSRIDAASQSITAQANAPQVAQDAIEELRGVVMPLLAAVADNGEVAQLGRKALNNANARKKALASNPQLTEEQRQLLTDAWELRIKATTAAVADLEKERMKFLQLMTYLQNQELFIAELAAIQQQDEVIKTIKELAKALSETSDDVSNIMASFNKPGV
ncbi:MAG: hypothetical protein ABR878_11830 [Roseiarcus sp.]|jgi:hypothetical protein